MDEHQGPLPDVRTDIPGTGGGGSEGTNASGEQTPQGNETHPSTPRKKKAVHSSAKTSSWKAWSRKRLGYPPQKKKTTKRHGTKGRKWTWGHINTFQPTFKWTKHGRLVRPTTRGTIPGCIYYAMKRLKRGSDKSVLQAALDDGLRNITKKQATLRRVQIELRLLARLGVIRRKKHPKGVKK